MFKLLIVDDEPLEREGLQAMIERSLPNMYEFYQAENGKTAIDLVNQLSPDILLIDIKMPGMSGLDAIREIKKWQPDIKVAMISAFDFFHYAKEAISLGVKEYLVKPTERQVIVDLMNRLSEEIVKERKQRKKQIETMDRISIITPAAETELALMLMKDHTPGFKIEPLLQLIIPNFQSGYAVTCIIPFSLDAEKNSQQKEHHQIKCIEKISHMIKHSSQTIVGPLMGNQMTFFVLSENSMSSMEYRKEATEIAQRLINKIKNLMDINASIGIGPIKQDISQFKDSYSLSLLATNKIGVSRFCFYDQLEEYNRTSENNMPDYQKIVNAIKNEELNDIIHLLNFLKRLAPNKQKQAILELDTLIRWHIYEKNFPIQIMDLETDLSFEKLFRRLTDNLESLRLILKAEKNSFKSKNTIDHAKQFIEKNYMKELTLEQVANEMNLSPFYFSKLFKQETNETFIDYVTKKRIEKAKTLILNMKMSLKEVCFTVGYHDPAYFTRVFKKIVRYTPSEYRKQFISSNDKKVQGDS